MFIHQTVRRNRSEFKIELAPGEEKTIHFTIPSSKLGLWNEDMKYVVEPGKFEFKIGRSFNDIRLKKFIHLSDGSKNK